MSNKRGTKRAHARRKAQKSRRKQGWLAGMLSVLFLTTIVAFAYLIGSQPPSVPRTHKALKSDRPAKQAVLSSSRSHALRAPKKKIHIVVSEEYPKEEEEEDYGLLHLIRKNPQHRSNPATPPKSRPEAPDKKPRLILVIDDISHPWQIREIRKLPYRITPSIFPPSELSEKSNRLALGLRHFMIHLPLQSASTKMNRMRNTLFVGDSAQRLRARVREIRRLFPTGRYLNNHTGSVFTSNYRAMKRLYGDLKAEGFIFVDSRTTGHSVVRKIAAEYGDRYIARDVFLDNVQKRSYILRQLRRAVRIARRRGYAIAIGHPHRATFDALAHAGKILQGVKTVYIDEVFGR